MVLPEYPCLCFFCKQSCSCTGNTWADTRDSGDAGCVPGAPVRGTARLTAPRAGGGGRGLSRSLGRPGEGGAARGSRWGFPRPGAGAAPLVALSAGDGGRGLGVAVGGGCGPGRRREAQEYRRSGGSRRRSAPLPAQRRRPGPGTGEPGEGSKPCRRPRL